MTMFFVILEIFSAEKIIGDPGLNFLNYVSKEKYAKLCNQVTEMSKMLNTTAVIPAKAGIQS